MSVVDVKTPDWQSYFAEYGGKMFEFPLVAGDYEGRNLAIFGDAACVWRDAATYGFACHVGRGSVYKENFDLMVINKVGETFPGHIAHWYSNEAKLMNAFIAARRNEYRKEFSTAFNTHSCNRGAKYHWPWGGWGTSGLGAIITGIALGYAKIVVCGMPLDESAHNGEPPWRSCRFTTEVSDTVGGGFNRVWRHAIKHVFADRVTFVSGRVHDYIKGKS